MGQMALPSQHWALEDAPTREGSVGTSFEGNMDALMHYIGRPSAPIPPTPFTQTGTPAIDLHAHLRDHEEEIPPLPDYAYPPLHFPHEPGAMTESTMSSPFDGNPFLPYQAMSLQSTPSVRGLNLLRSDQNWMRSRLNSRPGQTHPGYNHIRPPSSVSGESAEPQDTESEGEEDEDDVWIDEASDDDLDAEFHQDYIVDKASRRTRFESKMRTLVRQFRELDRTTDATMLLIASNPDQRHTHLVLSRSVRRHPNYIAFAQSARHSFAQVADSRRAERASRARMTQYQQRPSTMRRKSSGFMLSSYPAGQDNSGSATSDSATSVTRSAVASSMTSLPVLEPLKTLRAIDPSKMSAVDFRTAMLAELDKLGAVNGGFKQHAQAQPDSTEEMQRRALQQYQHVGLTGREGAEILWRNMQVDRSLSSTDATGVNGSDLR
ncbi:hypothetical protein DACRYDRAFT_24549 [Dacryopinax primogenitus]|uniref:Uncharacterized protein n=1 Tax=Dacryopinax primogenitus (strain DJM 731) TaxID=1858805 RepID=M5FY99_DACPD|nr:uncharacterized protein DACRYDRAFT_24549 [Dacryopinax primogenitus]EJT98531.1 hypothetical protein DACRYDRAFT_24549 [Dacryopinax primogenitus]